MGSFDEKYCSYELLYVDEEFKVFNTAEPTTLACSKNKTAHNKSLFAPQRETICTSADHLESCVTPSWTIFEKLVNYESQVPNSINSMSALKSKTCDNVFECPFREDECSEECFTPGFFKWFYVEETILKCYSFLFTNLEWFSFQWNGNENGVYYFNDSMLFYVSDVHDGFQASKSINFQDESILFKDKLKNLSIDLSANTLDICSNTFVECPWFFRCDSNKFEIIKTSKVCDFHIDCEDQSDEKYCSDETHFYCSNGDPIAINKNKLNDGNFDCNDRSDECKENQFSSAKEMIKNTHLRTFIWISFSGIIVFNLIVVTKNLKKIKSTVDKSSIKFYNSLFIVNLALSDIVYGLVLASIFVISSKFSGIYCTNDLEWRSSIGCNLVGTLTLSSSQTSLNVLFLITSFRLYTVYRPYRALDINKYTVYFLILVCWGLSFIISLIPLVFSKRFEQTLVISKSVFLNNKQVDRLIEPEELYEVAEKIEQVWEAVKPGSLPASKIVSSIINFNDWYFNDKDVKEQAPDTSIQVKMTFGFYSSSSVCLPDFFSNSSMASRFSVTLLSFNLLLIILISISYVLIFYKIKFRKIDKRSKNKSEENEGTVFLRMFLIVATDVACWLPIIVLSYLKYFGCQIPEIAHPISSIVLLPINSLLNPVLYSKIESILYKKIKVVVCILRNQFINK